VSVVDATYLGSVFSATAMGLSPGSAMAPSCVWICWKSLCKDWITP
jgi:hypothetical protein